jgi:hypothetical protein
MLASEQKQRVRFLSWALVAIESFTPFSPSLQTRAATIRRLSNRFHSRKTG